MASRGREAYRLSMAIAREVKFNGPDSSRLPDLRRALVVANISDQIAHRVAESPLPLSRAQQDELVRQIRNGGAR